ncbi:MAG: DDE-type integrase/transposase/recombinase, partial [Paracoccaceae bacterium]
SRMLKRVGCPIPIEMVRISHLNNMVEQDHRTIKKRIRLLLGFKSFALALAALDGIEVANVIRQGQLTPGSAPLLRSQPWQPKTEEIKDPIRPTQNLAT